MSSPTPTDWTPTNWEAEETPKDRLFRKLKEQPLVPAGALLTCAALTLAAHHLRKGNQEQMNKALRWRVYFQGITVVAAVGGLLYLDKKKPEGGGSTSHGEFESPSTSLPPANSLPVSDGLRAKLQGATTREEWLDLYRSASAASKETVHDVKEVVDEKAQKAKELALEQERKLEEALLRGVKDEERREIEERRRNRPTIGQDGRDRRAAMT